MKRIFQLFLILMFCVSCTNKKDIPKNAEPKLVTKQGVSKKINQLSPSKQSNSDIAYKHFKLGDRLLVAGNESGAIEQYKLAAKLEYPPAFGELALVYTHKDNLLALKYALQGVRYNDHLSFLMAGTLYCNFLITFNEKPKNQQDFEKGVSYLEQAIKQKRMYSGQACNELIKCKRLTESTNKYPNDPIGGAAHTLFDEPYREICQSISRKNK